MKKRTSQYTCSNPHKITTSKLKLGITFIKQDLFPAIMKFMKYIVVKQNVASDHHIEEPGGLVVLVGYDSSSSANKTCRSDRRKMKATKRVRKKILRSLAEHELTILTAPILNPEDLYVRRVDDRGEIYLPAKEWGRCGNGKYFVIGQNVAIVSNEIKDDFQRCYESNQFYNEFFDGLKIYFGEPPNRFGRLSFSMCPLVQLDDIIISDPYFNRNRDSLAKVRKETSTTFTYLPKGTIDEHEAMIAAFETDDYLLISAPNEKRLTSLLGAGLKESTPSNFSAKSIGLSEDELASLTGGCTLQSIATQTCRPLLGKLGVNYQEYRPRD